MLKYQLQTETLYELEGKMVLQKFDAFVVIFL